MRISREPKEERLLPIKGAGGVAVFTRKNLGGIGGGRQAMRGACIS